MPAAPGLTIGPEGVAWTASLERLSPGRWWLERFAVIVPGPAATRWLLVLDAACLVVVGLSRGRPWLGIPLALGAGFLGLNVLGMALKEFYVGLAVFHPAVGIATVVLARRWRWVGAILVAAALMLGPLT